jgi:hypothetical protein
MLPTLLLASALTSTTTGPLGTRIPFTETAAEALSVQGLRHHEALRIDRDFGKPEFDLVVDAWSETAHGDLADVRLWWVKTTANDRRSPLSTRAEKYVDIDVRRAGADAMRVAVRGGNREFEFAVELDAERHASVFIDVVTKDGNTVEHCRTTSGKLVAKRVLGIPVGLGALQVTCIDDAGRKVRGRATLRKVR